MQNYKKRWRIERGIPQKAAQQREEARFVAEQPFKKKSLGQHFLRRHSVVDAMIEKVKASCDGRVVLEIGCGDGFLTEKILAKTDCKKLICLELDSHWADFVSNKIQDPRLVVYNVNALDVDWLSLAEGEKMVMLANLPYNVSVPLIKKLREELSAFIEGVFMVQEEVAQRFAAKGGANFGSISVFLQHVLDFGLMTKIPPEAFSPPPQVDSRLVYFKPKQSLIQIREEAGFWRFIKACFASPRRMLRNNIKGYNFSSDVLNQKIEGLRAQQMTFEQLLELWHTLN